MIVAHFEPSEILKPFIREIKIVESHTDRVNRLLPDSSISMAFRIKGKTFSGESILPNSILTGIGQTARLVAYEKYSATLLVFFHEHSASFFFQEFSFGIIWFVYFIGPNEWTQESQTN